MAPEPDLIAESVRRPNRSKWLHWWLGCKAEKGSATWCSRCDARASRRGPFV